MPAQRFTKPRGQTKGKDGGSTCCELRNRYEENCLQIGNRSWYSPEIPIPIRWQSSNCSLICLVIPNRKNRSKGSRMRNPVALPQAGHGPQARRRTRHQGRCPQSMVQSFDSEKLRGNGEAKIQFPIRFHDCGDFLPAPQIRGSFQLPCSLGLTKQTQPEAGWINPFDLKHFRIRPRTQGIGSILPFQAIINAVIIAVKIMGVRWIPILQQIPRHNASFGVIHQIIPSAIGIFGRNPDLKIIGPDRMFIRCLGEPEGEIPGFSCDPGPASKGLGSTFGLIPAEPNSQGQIGVGGEYGLPFTLGGKSGQMASACLSICTGLGPREIPPQRIESARLHLRIRRLNRPGQSRCCGPGARNLH